MLLTADTGNAQGGCGACGARSCAHPDTCHRTSVSQSTRRASGSPCAPSRPGHCSRRGSRLDADGGSSLTARPSSTAPPASIASSTSHTRPSPSSAPYDPGVEADHHRLHTRCIERARATEGLLDARLYPAIDPLQLETVATLTFPDRSAAERWLPSGERAELLAQMEPLVSSASCPRCPQTPDRRQLPNAALPGRVRSGGVDRASWGGNEPSTVRVNDEEESWLRLGCSTACARGR